MKTTRAQRTELRSDLRELRLVLKGLLDEVRVQAHLGAMELKSDAGPYLTEVRDATQAARRDLVKRGQQLSAQLKRIRAQHRAS
ncbi:MAG: hypothetical protein JNG84_01925 [Archangium sp.]|nr:hypothetical protein [Archangium sp.]